MSRCGKIMLMMSYKRSTIITTQLQNIKFKCYPQFTETDAFLRIKFEQFPWNQHIPNYFFCFPCFPKVVNLHRFLLLLPANTSHIQGTEEELNCPKLNLGCIISNYKLSRILFFLIKSFQLFNAYIILICLTYPSVFFEGPERKQKTYRVYKSRRKRVCIV